MPKPNWDSGATAPWSRVLNFPLGADQNNPRRFDFGPPRAMGNPALGWLRVGFQNGIPPERFAAIIEIADSINVIGPIDPPFEIHVELPIALTVFPETALSAPVTLGAIVSLWTKGDDCSCGRSVLVTTRGGAVAVPQWCRAISLLNPNATGTFLDSLGAPMGTFQGWGAPRSRVCVAISVDQDSWVIFHY